MARPNEEPTDVVAEAERLKAREAARLRAIAPPPRPRRRTNDSAVGSYVQSAIDRETEAVANAGLGSRNDTLNTAAFNLGQLVGAHVLDRSRAELELTRAARQADRIASKPFTSREIRKTMKSGLDSGERKPRDMSDVGMETQASHSNSSSAKRKLDEDEFDPDGEETPNEFTRNVKLKFFTGISSRAPQWVWEHNEEGCLQLGTLCLFAGRPSAGKSTAARWLAAQLSNGTLPGIWHGNPVNVAIFHAEEQAEVTVATSLTAAGADLSRVATTLVTEGTSEAVLRAIGDEAELTEELAYHGVRCLIVDPIMETFDVKVDINRNNEVRAYLQPFVRIAKAINGIVVGVVHLRKDGTRDVLADINGSSAFGEVARSIIGFAEQSPDEPLRIIEQIKNSAGPLRLRHQYRLVIDDILTDDGLYVPTTTFEIVGPSELSIADIGNANDEEADQLSPDVAWLQRYLEVEQPAPSAQVKTHAITQASMSVSRLQRARRKLKVVIINDPKPDAPHSTAWCLPGSYAATQAGVSE